MLLGVIPCFVLGFWRKIVKVQKLENLGIIGLLRRSIGNPRRGIDLRQGMGYPRRGEAEVPKWHPSGTPWRSIATPRRRYCSQRAIFLDFCFQTPHIRTPVV